MTSADAPSVIALWEQAGLTRPWNPPTLDLKRSLNGPTSTVLGAFDDDRLAGTVMVGHDGHRGWIYYLAVEESHRGAGLGRELMSSAETWLKEHGAVKVQLMIQNGNETVLGFYDHLGYDDGDVQVRAKWLDR